MLLCAEKRDFCTLTKLSVFLNYNFLFSQKQPPTKLSPFPETHNLLSAPIKLRLFINTYKSLRSKIAVSHRFKILRAVWHKAAISYKDFLIATWLAA